MPLGNEFGFVTDEDAHATLEAAWHAGVRYFDVSPWYGLGLAERRFGAFLHNRDRDRYLISTKVGKLLEASPGNRSKSLFPYANSPNNGWGIGVNTPEPMLRVMQESDPDVCLLASQYSLIDHASALNNVFPVARAHGVGFVIGSALNAGFLSGSARYNYGSNSWNISREHLTKRERLRAAADAFGVDLRTAALQFSAAPDVAVALIAGAHTAAQAQANASSMQATIPSAFWAELKTQSLIERHAPVPAGGH